MYGPGRLTLTWVLWLHSWITGTLGSVAPREYCMLETFNASCASNEVIVMTSARYGRMRFGRCMKEDHGNSGCSADVIRTLDRKCSGRHTCNAPLPLTDLREVVPCPKELMPYLEASYNCVKVAVGNQKACQLFGGIRLTSDVGYMASVTASTAEIGVTSCPWIINVSPGKKISLSLLNFDTSASGDVSNTDYDQYSDSSCNVYIAVEDSTKITEVFVCDKKMRESPIYESHSSSVIVYIKLKEGKEEPRFLIKYQATGCPDITHLPNALVQRSADTLTVKCNYTGETYFLSCNGNDWMGEINNCTKPSSALGAYDPSKTRTRFPYGLLIVIGIGVALGVAVGIIMLFGILFCLRKRKEERMRSTTTDPLLYDGTPHDSEDTHSSLYERRSQYAPGMATLYRTPRACRTPDLYAAAEAAELQRMTAKPAWGASIDRSLYGTRRDPTGEEEPLNSKPAPDISQAQVSSSSNADMQTSFITFKPPAEVPGAADYSGSPRRSNMHTAASVDLVKDSEPGGTGVSQYRELNPETLVLECTCTLRHGQHDLAKGRSKNNPHCKHVHSAGNKSI